MSAEVEIIAAPAAPLEVAVPFSSPEVAAPAAPLEVSAPAAPLEVGAVHVAEDACYAAMDRYGIRPPSVSYRCGPCTFNSTSVADTLNFLGSFVVVAQSIASPDIILGCLLACLSTTLCWYAGPFEWSMSQNFVSVAVIWPVTQGISMGFSRREAALREFATLLAAVRSVWESLLTWQLKGPNGQWQRLADSYDEAERRAYRQLFDELLISLVAYFGLPRGQRARHTVGVCLASKEEAEIEELCRRQHTLVNGGIGRMRRLVQDMKVRGLPGGEAHRLDSYIHMSATAFEKLVSLKEYRTPRALRSYARVYITLMGAIYGPDYLTIAESASNSAGTQLGVALAYACVIQIVMGALFHVLVGLEDPFAGRRRAEGGCCFSERMLDGVSVPDLVQVAREQLASIEQEAEQSWAVAPSKPSGRRALYGGVGLELA